MSFIEQTKALYAAEQKKAVAEFLFLKAKDEITQGFATCIRRLAGHLYRDSPAANLEIERIEVEAIEENPTEEEPSNNICGWATWTAGEIGGNFHFDIGENEQVDMSWLVVTLELPTESEGREAEEDW